VFVEDLGSRNGTVVNGTRIAGPTRLNVGDVVEVGGQRFRYAGESVIEERPAPALYDGMTVAATRAGAPERLRLGYDLTRLAVPAVGPGEAARRLYEILQRTLRPAVLAVWLADEAAPVAGETQGSPFAHELLVARVLEGGQVLRVPGGNAPPTALALPLSAGGDPAGMVLIGTGSERPLAEDDV